MPSDLVLVGQLGPFVPDAAGQRFGGDPLDRGLRLSGAVTGRGPSVDIGRWKAVVPHRAIGPVALGHPQQR